MWQDVLMFAVYIHKGQAENVTFWLTVTPAVAKLLISSVCLQTVPASFNILHHFSFAALHHKWPFSSLEATFCCLLIYLIGYFCYNPFLSLSNLSEIFIGIDQWGCLSSRFVRLFINLKYTPLPATSQSAHQHFASLSYANVYLVMKDKAGDISFMFLILVKSHSEKCSPCCYLKKDREKYRSCAARLRCSFFPWAVRLLN